MDLMITNLPVATEDLPISPRFTPYDFLSRCNLVHKYSEKGRHLQRTNNKKGRRQLLLGNCVWLSGRIYIEERLNEGPWLQ